MKNLLLLFLTFFSIELIANQLNFEKFGSDSIQCVTNISLFREYVKQKNYDDALVLESSVYIMSKIY